MIEGKLTSVEFFVGNIFIAYILSIFISIVYFAVFHTSTLIKNLIPWLNIVFVKFSGFFFAYVLVAFLALFISALFAYIIARLLGSSASFESHISGYFDLTAIEPVSSLSCALCCLAVWSPIEHGRWLLVVAAFIFLTPKIWAAWMGYGFIIKIHNSSRYSKWIYAIGYVPSLIIVNIFMTASIIVLMMIMVGDLD